MSSDAQAQHALIVGASGGIGLAFVAALLQKPALARVYAACRTPDTSIGLQALLREHPGRLRLLALDVTREETLQAAATAIRDEAITLDLVINCVGVLHDAQGLRPERRLAEVNAAALLRSYEVNAVGALLLAKHIHPLLAQDRRAVLANLSARVGSIGDNQLGGWYGYRASKAAQNQITRNLAIELKRRWPHLLVVSLHPGTVDTGLSKPFQSGVPAEKLFTPERAARQLLDVVDALDASSSGQFFAWDGQPIPW